MSNNPHASTKFSADLEAHVVDSLKKNNPKRKRQYAVYTIDVSFAAAQWTVQRRFSEFVKFNSTLKSAFPTLRFLQLPSRLHKSLENGFLEKRRQRLNSFLIDVLDQVPLVVPILKCAQVMDFLEVMRNLQRHFATDKRTRGREFFPDLYASFPFNKKSIHLTIKHGMDKGDQIPIHIAAKEGSCEEISMIVKQTPNAISITDFLGQTALHVAARHGQAPVIRLLLLLSANRNTQDKRGWCPLHCACTSADLQSVLTLLEDEAVIPDLQNVDGNTPLHYFARNFGAIEAQAMIKSVLTLFTRKGSDINIQNKSGETPLHHACWRGSLALVGSLIASGADPNILTANGESALQWAVREGRTNIVQFFAHLGSRTESFGLLGSSPWIPVTIPGSYHSEEDEVEADAHESDDEDGDGDEEEEDDYDDDDYDADEGSESFDSDEMEYYAKQREKLKAKSSYESDTSSASSSASSSYQSPLSPPKFILGATPRDTPANPLLGQKQRKPRKLTVDQSKQQENQQPHQPQLPQEQLKQEQQNVQDQDNQNQQPTEKVELQEQLKTEKTEETIQTIQAEQPPAQTITNTTELPQQETQQQTQEQLRPEQLQSQQPQQNQEQDQPQQQQSQQQQQQQQQQPLQQQKQQQNTQHTGYYDTTSYLESPLPSPSTTPSETSGFAAKYGTSPSPNPSTSPSPNPSPSPSPNPNKAYSSSAPTWVTPSTHANSTLSSNSAPAITRSTAPPLTLSPEFSASERQYNYLSGSQRLPKLDESPDALKKGNDQVTSDQELNKDMSTLQVTDEEPCST